MPEPYKPSMPYECLNQTTSLVMLVTILLLFFHCFLSFGKFIIGIVLGYFFFSLCFLGFIPVFWGVFFSLFLGFYSWFFWCFSLFVLGVLFLFFVCVFFSVFWGFYSCCFMLLYCSVNAVLIYFVQVCETDKMVR